MNRRMMPVRMPPSARSRVERRGSFRNCLPAGDSRNCVNSDAEPKRSIIFICTSARYCAVRCFPRLINHTTAMIMTNDPTTETIGIIISKLLSMRYLRVCYHTLYGGGGREVHGDYGLICGKK